MKDSLNSKVIQTLATIASVAVATVWVEDRVSSKIKLSIEEAINPVASRVVVLEDKVKVLEDKVLIYTFKVDAYEKYFTKPKETKLVNE